jgi:hypothetical protein
MRRPLRHTLNVLRDAGIEVDRVHQGTRHLEIHLENGECIRLPHGNFPSRRHERGLRSRIRKILKAGVAP